MSKRKIIYDGDTGGSAIEDLHERVLAAGYPHWAQTDFWMWYDERPQRRQIVCVLLRRLPKLDVPLVYNERRGN